MANYTITSSVKGPVDVRSTLAGLDDMRLTLAGGTTTTLAGAAAVNSTVDSTAKVDTTSSVDLRPVAVDSCVRLELAPPPATEVSTPYEQQWSWSVLGLELFAVTVRGSTSTHIRPERHGPVVIDL